MNNRIVAGRFARNLRKLGPCVAMALLLSRASEGQASQPSHNLSTVLGMCYQITPQLEEAIHQKVDALRMDIRQHRSDGQLVGYLSIPLSSKGGGDFGVNKEVAAFLKSHLESHYGNRLWILNPADNSLPESATGADYMYMWTQVLAGEDGRGRDIDFVFFSGSRDFTSFFGSTPTVFTALQRYADARSSSDASFRTKMESQEKDQEGRTAKDRFFRYYGTKASISFSAGAHDEWNIFVEINRRRRGEDTSDLSKKADGLADQIPASFDGTSISPVEMETNVAHGNQGTCPPKLSPAGPLGQLDSLFLEGYLNRRVEIKNEPWPVIVVSGSDLIFHKSGEKKTVRVIPDVYHALKAVTHLPFATYLRVSPSVRAGTPLSDELVNELAGFQPKIKDAQGALKDFDLTTVQIKRQNEILTTTDLFVATAIKSRKITPVQLDAYAKRLGPLMLANANDAGCAQIQATHSQVMKWKQTMSSEEWQHLLVVNRAKHQARYRNAATQYFSWLMEQKGPPWSYPGESFRVVFAEFLGKEEDSTDLLATVLIDSDASSEFFGDSWRLSEDILSDGAATCIKKLPPADRSISKN
jgi:hypothetical protein